MTSSPPHSTDMPTIQSRGSDAYDSAWAAVLAAIVTDRIAGDVIAKLSLPELHLLIRIIVDGIEQRPPPASPPRSLDAQ